MTFTFKLSRRLALIFAAVTGGSLVGCSIDETSRAIPVAGDPLSAVGDTLFSDGFESGVLAWDDNYSAQSKQIVTAAARTGTRGLRVTFSPSTDAGTLSKFVTRGDRVFVRAAVRFPSNWTGATSLLTLRAATASNQWAGFGVSGLCPTGSTWALTGVTTTTPNLDLRFNTSYVGMPTVSAGRCQAGPGLSGPSTATYTAPLAVSKGVWHTVEIEAQLNTVGSADGWQRLWLDGALTGEWTGLTFRTTSAVQWNAISLDMYSSGVTQSQSLDIDDIVVQRQRTVAVAPVGSVQVAPSSVTINAGATASLTATVRDAAGAVLTGRPITWSSSQSGVATVSNSGVVTGVAAGTAAITATSEGQSGTATVTVQSAPAPQALFTESFENTAFSSRGWYDFATTPTVTTAERHSGTGSLRIQFGAGAQTPPMRVMRKLFTPTDRLYVSYWVKYSTNYVGSGRTYHPHEFNILSNQDQDWDGLTFNYLNAYIEQNYQNGGIPRIAIQDSRMVDINRIGVNLTSITEQRSIGGCNGNSDGTGVTSCYQMSSSQWYSLKTWDAPGVAFMPAPGPDYKGNWNHVEVEFQLNSIVGGIGQKDGVVRYWLNGNLKLERTNVMFRTGANPGLKFHQFLLAPYIEDGSPVTQQMWIDDLTVATAGPGTTPPPAPAPVASVTVTPSSASVNVGGTTQLSAVLRDAAGAVLSGRAVTWTTSSATVATVVNGVVTALSAGQATITATSEGRSGSAAITVTNAPQPVPVASVTVTPASASLQAGGTTQLSAVLRDAAGAVLSGRTVTWATSAGTVATVVNGLVTAVGTGQATVTATSEGRTGSATITVSNPQPPPGGSWPNQPAGMTIVSDYGFDDVLPTAKGGLPIGSSGWSIAQNVSSNGSAARVTDGTAPLSASSVVQFNYPTGYSGGGEPAVIYRNVGGGTELYIGFYWKGSNPWQNHPGSGVNKIFFQCFGSSGGSNCIIMTWQDANRIRLTTELSSESVRNLEPNATRTTVNPGQWYFIETTINRSTGLTKWWINGVLQGSHTVSYPSTGFGYFSFAPTWGGVGGTKSTNDWYRIDHVRISRR